VRAWLPGPILLCRVGRVSGDLALEGFGKLAGLLGARTRLGALGVDADGVDRAVAIAG
jgi:hypothetical protein